MNSNSKIRYYSFGSGNSSLFTHERYKARLKANGFIQVKNPLASHIIVCRNLEMAKKATLVFPFKKIIVHQTELFVDTTKSKTAYLYKVKPVIVINGFNEGVFFNNYHFLASYLFNDECDLGMKKGVLKQTTDILTREQFDSAKPIVFVGQKRGPDMINKNNLSNGLDLNVKRQELAQRALERGVGDVVGKGWSQLSGIKNSGFDSGVQNWWDIKLELLKGYRFNIAYENTIWPYYITEKIWHSILAGCLPVYWGQGSSIYKSFPRNSFVDASEFKSSDAVIDFMVNLSYDSWVERMERCIKVYNDSLMKMNYSKLDEAIEKISERITEARWNF